MDEQKTHEVFSELRALSQLVERQPESFASGSQDISATALKVAKIIFDLCMFSFALVSRTITSYSFTAIQSELASRSHINDLISSLEPSHAPQTRSQVQAEGKRKRSSTPPFKPEITFEITPLSSLFVEGMTEDQVWAQLDLRTKNICDILDLALVGEEEEDGDVETAVSQEARLQMTLTASRNGEEVDFDGVGDIGEDEDEEDLDEHPSLDELEDDQSGEDDSGNFEELEEGVMNLQDPSSDDDSEDEDAVHPGKATTGPRGKKRKTHSLDDGFFDLASFNAETERAEARSSSRGRLGGSEESDEDDMSVDLFAPIQNDNFEEDDLENDPGGNTYDFVEDQCKSNTNAEALYRDFFEPPSSVSKSKLKQKTKKALPIKTSGRVRFHDEVRVKKIRANGKNLPLPAMGDDEDDIEDDSEGDDGFGEDGDMEDSTNISLDDSVGHDFDGEFNSDEDDMDEDDENEQGRRVMERLKGDLFAEDEDGLHQGGLSPSRFSNMLTTSQIFQHTRSDWRRSKNKSQNWNQRTSDLRTGCSWERLVQELDPKTLY